MTRTVQMRLVMRIALSLACIAILAVRLDWRQVWEVFAGMDIRIAALAILISPIAILLLAWRLTLLLGSQGIRLRYLCVLRLTWTAQFCNAFLPGTTGGDMFKLYAISRLAPDQAATGAAVVVVDRILALSALGLLAAIGFVLDRKPLLEVLRTGVVQLNQRAEIAGMVLLALVFITYLFRKQIARLSNKAKLTLSAIAKTVEAAYRTLRFNRYTVASTVVAVCVHIVSFTVVFLLAHSIHIAISFRQVFEMMPVVMLVIALPITINGHGLREIVMISYFEVLNIQAQGAGRSHSQIAVALSLAFVANDMVCSMFGGLWSLFPASQTTLGVEPVPDSRSA